MKKHKVILALMALMIIIFSILVKAQVPTIKQPPIPIPIFPPAPTISKQPLPPLIPTSTPPKSLSTPFVPFPTPSASSSAPLFPSVSSQPLPKTTPTEQIPVSPPATPTAPKSAILSTPTPTPTSTDPPSCNTSNDCPDPKKLFCNYSGKCQYKGQVGDKCDNDNNEQCVDQLICSQNVCGYEDLSPNKEDHSNYNIKKVAMTGGIIVGISAVSGLIFLMSRYLKNRKERKNREITSNIYSTDDEMTEPDPSYPFSESTNSFSDKTMPLSHDPYINHYDHIPPTRNGGFVGPRSGFRNYYNNEYNDGVGGVTRTMDPRNLQQTRGNVIMPPPQQNYNWNYGVPQQLMMNQGGLFPIPLERNYGVPKINNIGDDNNNSFPREGDKSKYNRERKDSNTLSGGNVKSKLPTSEHENNNSSNRMYNVSIYDAYTRDSVLSGERQNSKSDKNKIKYTQNL